VVIECFSLRGICVLIGGDVFRVKNSHALHRTFNVQPIYLRHENTGNRKCKYWLLQMNPRDGIVL